MYIFLLYKKYIGMIDMIDIQNKLRKISNEVW